MSNNDRESDDDSDSEWNDELINAVRRKQGKSKIITEEERIDRIQECLNEGADVDAVDKEKNTALHTAVKKGYIKVARFLIEQRAKTDIPNRNGHTAIALAEAPGKEDILSVLKGLVNRHNQLPAQQMVNPIDIMSPFDQRASTSRAGILPVQISPIKNDTQNLKRKNTTDIQYSKERGKQQRLESDDSVQNIDEEDEMSFDEDTYSEVENDDDKIDQRKTTVFGKENRYAASGLKQTLHGNIYQLKLLMLFLKRGLHEGYAFRLATEMDVAEKFDDLVFQCKNTAGSGTVCRFLQAKHKLDDSKTISVHDLLTEKDDEFSLQKYFISFCKIKKHSELSKSTLKDFTICTNIDFNFKDLKSANIGFNKVTAHDAFLDMESSVKQPARYKLLVAKQSELYQILTRTAEAYTLAKTLLEHIYESKDITLRNDIFKLYHIVLAKEIIDVKNRKFYRNFVDGTISSVKGKKFRKIFYEQALKRKKLSEKTASEKIVWGEITKNPLKVSSTFGQQPKSVFNPTPADLSQLNSKNELPSDEVDINDITEFFDKLIFAVNQPNEDELGDIITREIADESHFNLLNADLVGASFQKKMLDWFKEKGREKGKEGSFFSNEDGRAFFDSVERKVNTLLSSGLSIAYPAELKEYGIEFEDENRTLKNFLTSTPGDGTKPALNLIAAGDTLPSAIRVLQTLQQTGRYEKKDSLIFLRLRTLLLPGVRNRVLCAFESPDSHHLLVIECGSSKGMQNLKRLYYRLEKTMKTNVAKKLIFVTQGNKTSGNRSNIRFKNCCNIYENISFNHLTASSRLKLLEKPIINFQGRHASISFGRLLGIRSCNDILSGQLTNFIRLIDPSYLVKLICDVEIKVGDEVRGLDKFEDYYINRRFNREVANRWAPRRFMMDGGEIRSFDQTTESSFTEVHLAEHSEEHKIVMISDTAGMGKTTVLTYIAKTMKKMKPGLWVIRIDLNDFTNVLQTELKSRSFDVGDINGTVDFFVEKLSNLQTDLEKETLKIMIKSSCGVAVLFDGFDEISPQYKNIVIELLQAFHNLGVEKLFVTTRPHMRTALEDGLVPFSYVMEPFSKENRIDFLIRFWKKRLDLNDVEQRIEMRLESYATALIEKVCITIDDRMNEFAGVPLHTRMIAEVCENNRNGKLGNRDVEGCEEFLHSEMDEPKLPEKMNIVNLYRSFVDEKYFIYRVEKKKEDPSNLGADEDSETLRAIFLQSHQRLALYMLFDTEDETILELHQQGIESINAYLRKINEGKERTGIITRIINGRPQFIHRTFAEYFVADFLINTLKRSYHSPNVRAFIIEQILLHPNHRIIRAFLNGLLKEQFPEFDIQHKSNTSTDGSWQMDLNEKRGSCGGTIFQIAAKEANFATMKFFLIQFCNDSESRMKLINAKDNSGRTVLFEIVSLQKRIKPKWPMGHGELKVNFSPPLNESASHDNLLMMKWLVENGAMINDRCNSGKTPLFDTACFGELPMMKWLVDEKKADLMARDKDDRTVLHEAASAGQLDVVEWLLDMKKADLNAKTRNGETVLYHAACNYDWDFVMWLLDKSCADINAEIYRDQPILYTAVLQNRFDIAKWLVMEKNADINIGLVGGKPFMHLIIRSFDLDFIKWLVLVKGADVNITAEDGTTILHYSASISSFGVATELRRGQESVAVIVEEDPARDSRLIPIVKWLVEEMRIDIEAKSHNGDTALHIAARCGNWNLVKWLVMEKNANLKAEDHKGRTIWHMAASSGNWDAVKVFAKSNVVGVNVEDRNGKTVLQYAIESRDLDALKWLVENENIDVNAKLTNEQTILHCAVMHGNLPVVEWLVTDKSADLKATYENGKTILHEAVGKRNWKVLRWLVETGGADVNVRDNSGTTLLHAICSSGNLETLKWLVEKRDADLNVRDNYENTLLHKAAVVGNIGVIRYLVNSNKIDITTVNKNGDAAADVYRKFHRYNLNILRPSNCSQVEQRTNLIPTFQGMNVIRDNQLRAEGARKFHNFGDRPHPRFPIPPPKNGGEPSVAR